MKVYILLNDSIDKREEIKRIHTLLENGYVEILKRVFVSDEKIHNKGYWQGVSNMIKLDLFPKNR